MRMGAIEGGVEGNFIISFIISQIQAGCCAADRLEWKQGGQLGAK